MKGKSKSCPICEGPTETNEYMRKRHGQKADAICCDTEECSLYRCWMCFEAWNSLPRRPKIIKEIATRELFKMTELSTKIELDQAYHCSCGRFYILPFLQANYNWKYQVKDFIGGGCCVYLHDTLEDAQQRVLNNCECCQLRNEVDDG